MISDTDSSESLEQTDVAAPFWSDPLQYLQREFLSSETNRTVWAVLLLIVVVAGAVKIVQVIRHTPLPSSTFARKEREGPVVSQSNCASAVIAAHKLQEAPKATTPPKMGAKAPEDISPSELPPPVIPILPRQSTPPAPAKGQQPQTVPAPRFQSDASTTLAQPSAPVVVEPITIYVRPSLVNGQNAWYQYEEEVHLILEMNGKKSVKTLDLIRGKDVAVLLPSAGTYSYTLTCSTGLYKGGGSTKLNFNGSGSAMIAVRDGQIVTFERDLNPRGQGPVNYQSKLVEVAQRK